MWNSLFDYLVFAAFFLISIDIIFQITRVKHEHESRDISIIGAGLRLFASTVFLIKFILLSEFVLIIGQSIFLTIFGYYIGVLLYYQENSAWLVARGDKTVEKTQKKGSDQRRHSVCAIIFICFADNLFFTFCFEDRSWKCGSF